MKKLLFFLPLFAIVFVSCEQDANVDVPEVDPKLVINCFITPQDSLIRAHVSLSTPVFNNNLQNGVLDNATVVLYGNSSSVTLVYNSTTEWYEASASGFPIIAGNEYHITASTPAGLNADAYTTVPASGPMNFNATMNDTILNNDPWNTNGEARFDYSFDDQAGQTDFYRVMAYEVHFDPNTMDTTLQRDGWENFSDENADGNHISRDFIAGYYYGWDSLVAFDLYLIHCNYDYYQFHRSLDNYSGDNPFAEPTLVYSNINNGLGIFGAANERKLRFWR